MSVPNQKIIYIKRSSDKDKVDFFKVSNNNLDQAAKDLDGKSFKLWVYLADNKDGYRKEMYPVDFCNWSGLSDSSYRRAWEELETKGYVIQSPKVKNMYLFKETSDTYNERHKNDLIKSIETESYEDIVKEFFNI